MSINYDEAFEKTGKHINLHAKCVESNAHHEFECTNYGTTKVNKPYRAKFNDQIQIVKMVPFS